MERQTKLETAREADKEMYIQNTCTTIKATYLHKYLKCRFVKDLEGTNPILSMSKGKRSLQFEYLVKDDYYKITETKISKDFDVTRKVIYECATWEDLQESVEKFLKTKIYGLF